MSRAPIVLPDLGSPNCRLSLWLVRVGERVREGDRVAEVAFPGAIVDVSAPIDGVVRERFVQPGDALAVGQTLGTIEPTDP